MTDDKPTHARLSDRLIALVGSDIHVSFDHPDTPSRIQVYRPDPIAEPLLRQALDRMTSEFPAEMGAITHVFVDFEGDLGRTRRRVTLA